MPDVRNRKRFERDGERNTPTTKEESPEAGVGEEEACSGLVGSVEDQIRRIEIRK